MLERRLQRGSATEGAELATYRLPVLFVGEGLSVEVR